MTGTGLPAPPSRARALSLSRAIIDRIAHPSYHGSATIWAVLVLFIAIVTFAVPEFLLPGNIENVLVQFVPLGIASLGQLFVILGGGIDLSIGPLIGLTTIVLSSVAADSPQSILVAIALCVAIGTGVGLANGLLDHYARIPPLIVTLCTGFIVQGVAFAIHQTSGGFVPRGLSDPLTTSWGFISMPLLLYVAAALGAGFLLYRSPYGRHLFALGGNEEVLYSAGVRVARIRVGSYVVAGILAAIAGIYLAARLGSGSSHYGDGYALTTIAAVVIGGTSLAGGQGSLSGTVAGALIVSMLNNVLNNISFRYGFDSSFYKDVMTGLVLIAAMLFYRRGR